MTRRHGLVAALLGAIAVAVGCSVLTDFERFEFEGPDAGVELDGGARIDFSGVVIVPPDDLARTAGEADGGVLSPSNGFTCPGGLDNVVDLTQATEYELDTDGATLTDSNDATVLTGTVTGNAAIFCARSFTIPANSIVQVTGERALVFVVSDTFYLAGQLRLRGERGEGGAGFGRDEGKGGDEGPGGFGGGDDGEAANPPSGGGAGGTGPQQPNNGTAMGAGGGGGGGRLLGAPGGKGQGAVAGTGGSANVPPPDGLPVFVGGGGGGGGGEARGTPTPGGGGGGGGGALQVSALGATGRIILTGNARIDVAGGGGGPGRYRDNNFPADEASGGGGGGAGGMVWLEGAIIDTTGLSVGCVTTVGGAGGAGGIRNVFVLDGTTDDACPLADLPFVTNKGAGGAGGGTGTDAPSAGAQSGTAFDSYGAGGGGGAPGWIVLRSTSDPVKARLFPMSSVLRVPLP